MLVHSHNSFWVVADFDERTGELNEFRRRSAEDPPVSAVRGEFITSRGGSAVFYRHHELLWLRIGEVVRAFDGDGCEVQWRRAFGRATLDLLDRGVSVASVQYAPGPGGEDDDPTPFADQEDWDFGLFVKNVLENEGRSRRVFGGRAS